MNKPNCMRGSSIYVSREWRPLRWIYPHDLVESAEADVERRVRDQLDDLGFREVAAHLGPERVVNLVVVHGELLGEPDGGPLARAQEVRALVVDRRDLASVAPACRAPARGTRCHVRDSGHGAGVSPSSGGSWWSRETKTPDTPSCEASSGVTPASDPPGYEYTSADCDVGATESYLLLSWNALIVSGTG